MIKLKYAYFFSLSFALFFLASCALTAKIPSSRFESAEVPGHKSWRFSGGGGTAQTVNYTDDASSRPPIFNTTIDNGGFELPILRASVGLSEYAEIGFKYGFPSGYMLKAKLQLLGKTARDAKEGNLALAMTLGLGLDDMSQSGDQNGLFGGGGHYWSSHATTRISDFALILGYRPADHVAIFFSPFISAFDFNGNIHQKADSTYAAADYNLSGSGVGYGGSFGAQFYFGQTRRNSMMFDLTEQHLRWTNATSVSSLGGGILYEFQLL